MLNRPSEISYGRVPFVGSCRLVFIYEYGPYAALPGTKESAFPVPRGPGICPGMAAWSVSAAVTHKAQSRLLWPSPPASRRWHWIPLP